eukprot:1714902-Pyramimonas_sp.AAC.1
MSSLPSEAASWRGYRSSVASLVRLGTRRKVKNTRGILKVSRIRWNSPKLERKKNGARWGKRLRSPGGG